METVKTEFFLFLASVSSTSEVAEPMTRRGQRAPKGATQKRLLYEKWNLGTREQ
ncbi:MAG: hypothetical protein KBS65_03620 [Prevotella sp.]|nr:hypothetical protein [Candidatus Equicola stercoris]